MSDIKLEYLTSKKLYNQWNEKVNASSYLSDCFCFPSAPYNIQEKINDLCRKILRNLDGMQYRENDEYYTCGRCKLLNYWLYDELKKILSSQYQNKYREIITELQAAWSKYKFYKIQQLEGSKFIQVEIIPKCKPDNTILNLNDIDHKKNIHEHCLNYYEISKNIHSDECKNYKAYIQRQSLPYEKFESLFPEEKYNCLTYYKNCKSYNPKNISNYSNCPQEIVMAEVSEDVAAISGQSSLEGAENEDEGAKSEEGGAKSEEGGAGREEEQIERIEKEEKGDNGMEGEDDKSPRISQLPRHSSIQDLSTSISEGDTLAAGLPSIPDSTDNARSNGTIISVSCVGITGFLFLLYKFTPLRSVLDPRIRKTKKNLKNGVQGSNELQSHDYDFYPPGMDINRYNIAYQSR